MFVAEEVLSEQRTMGTCAKVNCTEVITCALAQTDYKQHKSLLNRIKDIYAEKQIN